MAKINVTKVAKPDQSLAILDEFDAVAERVRQRAYDLFVDRGYSVGQDLDDWLTAEREICHPQAELIERTDAYELNVSLAGFDTGDISVTATSNELFVNATHSTKAKSTDSKDDRKVLWSEIRTDTVYRRVALPGVIDVKSTTASLDDGILTIRAPKEGAAKPAKKRASARKAPAKKAAKKKAKKKPARKAAKKK